MTKKAAAIRIRIRSRRFRLIQGEVSTTFPADERREGMTRIGERIQRLKTERVELSQRKERSMKPRQKGEMVMKASVKEVVAALEKLGPYDIEVVKDENTINVYKDLSNGWTIEDFKHKVDSFLSQRFSEIVVGVSRRHPDAEPYVAVFV